MDLNNGKFCFIENNHASMVNDRTNGLVTMLVDSKVSKCRSLCYQIPNQKPFQSVVKISPNRRNIFYGLMVFSITGIVILLIAVALSILYFRYPCQIQTCKKNKVCEISKNGTAFCTCKTCLPTSYQLYCGSDNTTYQSICDIERNSCLSNSSLHIQHIGPCINQTNEPTLNSCDYKLCSFYAICVQNKEKVDLAECQCPKCDNHLYDPVCGSDAVTYPNLCSLQKHSCIKQTLILAKYFKPCGSCDNVECKHYAVCEINYESRRPECVCPKVCLRESNQVCGSNNQTYENECELRMNSCLLQKDVQVAYKGPCDECKNIICKPGLHCENGTCVCNTNCWSHFFEPICANDGNTYQNHCELQKINCLRNQNLRPIYFGTCQEMTTALVNFYSEIKPINIDYGLRKNQDNFFKEQNLSCDTTNCKFGGHCTYNEFNKPICECAFDCESTELFSHHRKFFFFLNYYDKVCGSNKIVYKNICHLKSEACRNQKEIHVVSFNFCVNQSLIEDESKTDVDKFEDNCKQSKYGCCLDGKLKALGPNFLGCPERCFCNKRGSLEPGCDPITRQCKCKPGISGIKCNRCEPGFWGLHKIRGNEGCLPCNCNKYGSVRIDCEQETGECVCISSVTGIKCDQCPQGTNLGPQGCTHGSINFPQNGSCNDINCLYGAVCVQSEQTAKCICDINCSKSLNRDNQIICGSDSNTYLSECQLTKASCLYQIPLFIKHYGPC